MALITANFGGIIFSNFWDLEKKIVEHLIQDIQRFHCYNNSIYMLINQLNSIQPTV